MIQIAEHAEGCVLAVRAQPGARRNAVVGDQGGSLKVAVTAPPEDGRANKALLEVLAKELGVRRSQLELLSGHTGRQKRVLVRGATAQDLHLKVVALVNP